MASVDLGRIECVLLARHGLTEWNRVGRRQGQLDSPLTPAGLANATQLAQLAMLHPVDAVFSSPLGRAMTTAAVFAETLNLDAVPVDELQEVNHGAMAGLTNDEIDVHYPGELLHRSGDKYRWRFPEGESYADANLRAATALTVISDSGCRFPLVVSHEMIGRMVMRNLLDLTVQEALGLSHPHDVLYRVDPGTKHWAGLRA